MRWRILGPVEASAGEKTLDLVRPQQRALLGLLLLNADHLISIDQIEAALWANARPASARTQVQVCVSRIRAVLRTGGMAEELASQSGGYRLTVATGELDLAEFTRLVQEARTATNRGQAAVAADRLRAGLALWRGPALAGASGAFVAGAALSLDEQRLTAYELLAEAELGLGRPDAVVRTLRPLAELHPLRERLVGQLMIALAGCGQQSQALHLFDRTRSQLAENLGLDPGADLTAAQLRVLRQQVTTNPPASHLAQTSQLSQMPPTRVAQTQVTPTLDSSSNPAAHQTPRPGWPRLIPAQLPADIPGFTGRSAALDDLDALLAPSVGTPTAPVVISAIGGTAGVGKTALALHWAHRIARQFPDGQLYLNLRGFDLDQRAVVSASDALRGFLEALGVPAKRIPAESAHQAGLYRTLLAGRRMLIVLDNARNADQVRPLLPGTPGCLAIITSRDDLSGLIVTEGARPLVLDVLSEPEAEDLLAHRIGPDRIRAEPDAVTEIIACCSRLPLALAIVGARAATRPGLPLASLATDLRGLDGGLTTFDTGDPAIDVRAVFSWSYHALEAQPARLFRLLGLHPGPDFSLAAVASLAGDPPAGTRSTLTSLTRAHLLTERSRSRYSFHDLLRVYAAELGQRIDGRLDRRSAQGRLFDHYLHVAHAADLLLDPHQLAPAIPLPEARTGVSVPAPVDPPAAMNWLVAERECLLAMVPRAAETGFEGHAWRLAAAITTFLDRRGYWSDLAEVQQVALAAAQHQGDGLGRAQAHRGLAIVNTWLGHYDQARAHYECDLGLYRESGDVAGEANTHIGLSWMLARRGNLSQALDATARALALFEAVGSLPGQAKALNNLGWLHARLGDLDQALICCHRALALHGETGDRHGTALTWDNLGYAHHCLGQHDQSTTCYRTALALHRDLGDRYDEADVLANLGEAQHAAGDATAALTAWANALAIYDELGHPDAERLRAMISTLSNPGVSPR